MTGSRHTDAIRLVTEVLAVHGGLNDHSTRALLEVARLHDLSANQLREILEQVARHEHDATILKVTHAAENAANQSGATPSAAIGERHSGAPPPRTAEITLSLFSVLLYVSAVFLLVLTVFTITGEPTRDATADDETLVQPPTTKTVTPTPQRESAEGSPAREMSEPEQPSATYDELLGPFDEAPDRFRTAGLDAIPPIAETIEHLSRTWPALERSTVEAAANRIARLMIVLEQQGQPEYARRVLDLVLKPSAGIADRDGADAALAPRQIVPAAWSIGVVTRLTKETHPDPDISDRLESHLSSVFMRDERPYRPSFREGAAESIVIISRRMIDAASTPFADADESAWDEVGRALSALRNYRERTARAAVFDLLAYALRNAGDPSDRSFVGRGLDVLVSRVDWSARESGQALLGWFDDPDVPTPSLAALVRTIAGSPTAPDGAPLDALTRSAPPIQRARVRDRLARAYTLPTSTSDGWVAHAWAPALARALEQDPASSDPVAALAQASTFARLNAAAALRWQGEFELAERESGSAFDAVAEARERLLNAETPEVDARSLTSPASPSDGRFARAYLNAGRNAEARLEAINAHTRRRGPIEPADADVLAQAAFYAVPVNVRRAAQRAALDHADNPAMTHALLESLDDAPRLKMTREFLSSYIGGPLPEHDAPNWTIDVRRAVLAKLHEQLSARHRPLVRTLASDLQRTYRLRARGPGPPAGAGPAGRIYAERLELASRFGRGPLESLASERVGLRHARRTSISRGPIQRFHAHQLSAMELFAYTVASERPSAEARIRAIVDRLNRERAGSTHIFFQVVSTERALAQLWAVRLAVQDDAGTGADGV